MTTLSAMHDKTVGVIGQRRDTTAQPPGTEVDYKRLLGPEAWAQLPATVQGRFEHTSICEVTYVGCFETVEANFSGRCLAKLCRYLGEPLVALVGREVPAHVRVYGDHTGGTVWERTYHFAHRHPRTVRSAKRLDDAGTLVECLGLGLRMRLNLSVEGTELHFHSNGYYWECLGFRLPLPRKWFPGETLVIHRDEGGGWFRFILSIDPLLGRIAYQNGVFRKQETP